MHLLYLVFTILSIVVQIIIRMLGLLGDYFLLGTYSLVVWYFFGATAPVDVVDSSFFKPTSSAFAISFYVFAGLSLAALIIYQLYFKKITSYAGWIYAVRTFLLCVLLLLMATAGATRLIVGFGQYDPGFVHDFVLAVPTAGVLLFCAWVFFSLVYLLDDWVQVFRMNESQVVVPQTVMSPRRMFAILFTRQPEYRKQYMRTRQSFRRPV